VEIHRLSLLSALKGYPMDLVSGWGRRWQVTRTRGRARFILVKGALYWGLSVFVFVTFVLQRHAVVTVQGIIARLAL
jgi:hypothetical protein